MTEQEKLIQQAINNANAQRDAFLSSKIDTTSKTNSTSTTSSFDFSNLWSDYIKNRKSWLQSGYSNYGSAKTEAFGKLSGGLWGAEKFTGSKPSVDYAGMAKSMKWNKSEYNPFSKFKSLQAGY